MTPPSKPAKRKRQRNPEKKSEFLDIRLPHSVKKDFMAATKQRGETASEAVRRFIDIYVAETPAGTTQTRLKDVAMTVKQNPLKTLGIAALSGGAMTLAALPSAADDTFARLDKDSNGVLVVGEIAPGHDEMIIEILDVDKSGDVSRAEFENPPEGVTLHADVKSGDDASTSTRLIKIKRVSTGGKLTEAELDAEIRDTLRETMPDASEAELDAAMKRAVIKTIDVDEVEITKD